MLDGIDPDGLGTLNDMAGMAIGTGIVFAVISAGIGVYLWLGGRLGKFSGDKSAKGLNSLWLACLGVTFLTSVSGAISWGVNTGGTENLMPEAARPKAITVEREAPVSTCGRNSAVRNFDLEDDVLDHEERMEILEAVAEGADGDGFSKPDYGAAVERINESYDGEHPVVRRMVWTPQQSIGETACDGKNMTSSPGTEVRVSYAPYYEEDLEWDEGLATITLNIPEATEE